jgi:D-alanine-D-alanine ligase
MASKLKILLLFDLSVPIKKEEYPEYLKTEEWKTEAGIYRTLRKLGHEVQLFGLHNDIQPLIDELRAERPDLVFNLCEAFGGDRQYEPHVASLLELMRIPYTGAGVMALKICKDKGLTKKILSYHRIHLPRFEISHRSHPLRSLKRFTYPAFIKPLQLEASEGISQVSFANTEREALERVKYINERLEVDAIVEEYIDGREIYVSIIGNDRLQVFPARELFFKQVPEGEPKFATFRAKWNETYRKKWGIDTGSARSFPKDVEQRIDEACKKIYRLLKLRGYGRIDLRVKPNGEVYFIEANPNPSIAREDDFALSAEKGGMDYESLIAKIISLTGA